MPLWLVAVAGLLLAPLHAFAGPDLVPDIYAVALATDQSVGEGDVGEGCAGASSGRTLLRFGMRAHNQGDAPEVIGDPGCPDCALFPGAPCANPDFQCSAADGHMHPHFAGFARYELLDMRGNVVALGAKRGFCMRDDGPADCPMVFDCSYQGISPGCFDDYGPNLGCQYIDVTDVPGIETRAFRLRVTVDPLELLADDDRSNNAAQALLPGCGDGTLDAGEECDPGLPVVGACCDADCHLIPGCDTSCALRPAGAVCRPATGPCDLAELCDGASPSCPADAALVDGSPCGGDATSSCLRDVCRAGACVVERQRDGCLIGPTCWAAGAVDPADACQHCDPERTIDLWSPDRDPDAAGVGCQLARVEQATQRIGCPPRTTAAIARRLTGAQRWADRLASARPARAARLETKLLRAMHGLSRLLERGRRRGCSPGAALAELAALEDQLRAMKAGRAESP